MSDPSTGSDEQQQLPPDASQTDATYPNDVQDEEEEEFMLHLKFDHGSYPLRHNVNDINFLGIVNGSLFVRIGSSYFMGEYDQRNHSSILFSYDKPNQAIYETHKCRSKILMKRVLLKSKETQQNPT